MKILLSTLVAAALATAGTGLPLLAAAQAAAQAYPAKPIRMIVPYAPGGGMDAITRLVAPVMAADLGQSIVIENRAGGGGMIGADAVAKATPDGYTVLMAGNGEMVISPTLSPGRYNVARDFIPVMLISESANIIVAHPRVKGTLRELLAGTSGESSPLSVGTPGLGSAQHLSVEILKTHSQAELVAVPYKGAAPAVTDALGGQVKLVVSGAPTVLQHVRSGKLRALAVTQPRRTSLASDIPTIEEAAGIKGMDVYTTWYGLLVPAGTPAAIVETLQKSIAGALARPDVRARLAELGTEVLAQPGAAFGERIRTELRRHEEVIRRFNIKAE